MKVRIKTWQEMIDQYGVDSDGAPDVEAVFPEKMEEDLPDDRIVNVESDGCGVYEIDHKGCERWTVSEDMIAEYIEQDKIIFSKTYDNETLNDLNDDLYDAINQLELPQDENGFIKGQFTVQGSRMSYKRGHWPFNSAVIKWILNRRPSHVSFKAKQKKRHLNFNYRLNGVFLNRTKYKQKGKKHVLYYRHW